VFDACSGLPGEIECDGTGGSGGTGGAGGTAGSGGIGGEGGTGGADPSILCNVDVCMTDSAAKALCESAVQACIDTQTGDDLEQCIAGMILIICIAGG
jgi:hypothetical protein